jgi:sugar phosphate permease
MDRRKQLLAFGLTWLAYATYYLGRRGFSVVKKTLEKTLGVSDTALGRIDTAYLSAYSLGQFVSGFLGDRVGARRLIGFGMLLSAAACVAFGSFSTAIGFGVAFAVNGLAQATGWPGTTRAMADWTTPQNRGTIMGRWSTNYQVGGFVAVWLAGSLATSFGWRYAFFVPAALVALVGLANLAFLPSPPEPSAALGASTSSTSMDPAPVDRATIERERREAQLAVVKNPTLWLYASSYFFIKLIRYALLFWLPYYLETVLGYSTLVSARVATAFDAGGFVGVIAIGYLSDRYPRLGRAGISFAWLIGLALACVAYSLWGGSSQLVNVLLLGLIGVMLFGPDSILCGAAAQDAGGPRAASMATGFVNGVGSVGPILQGLLVPPFAHAYGYSALFKAFIGLALCAAVVLVPALRRRADPSSEPRAKLDS